MNTITWAQTLWILWDPKNALLCWNRTLKVVKCSSTWTFDRYFWREWKTWIGKKVSPLVALPSCVILLLVACSLARLKNMWICCHFEYSWLGGFNTRPSIPHATNISRLKQLVNENHAGDCWLAGCSQLLTIDTICKTSGLHKLWLAG